METKSRYEVISDLEAKKRELIKEKNSLNDVLLEKHKALKLLQRQKDDTIVILDRQIEDATDAVTNFEKTMEDRKGLIEELIKSTDDSLNRFNKSVSQ